MHPDNDKSKLESFVLHLVSLVMFHIRVPIANVANDAEEVALTKSLLTFLISHSFDLKLYLMTDFSVPM